MSARVERTSTEAETIELGRRIGRSLGRGAVVLLIGELGAGKTTIAKGIIEGLGAAQPDDVASPTYTLIHEFGEDPKVYHIDLYRIERTSEVLSLGIDEVLDLLPSLAVEFPSLRYLVIGEGDDRPRLEAKADALGVRQLVTFGGQIPEAEKADHYRLADAFVMAGRGEGFGFVFLEAMACGVPVVASIRDGSREAVRDGALGLLADPDDPESLRSAIRQALRQPRRIPQGLDYFAYPRFRERVSGVLAAVFRTSGTAG